MSGHELRETSAARTLRDCELMAMVGLKHAAFYRRKERGEFRFLELKPQLPNSNTLYSRALVERWLSGEVQAPERFFGRATPRVPGRRPVGRPRKRQDAALVVVGGSDAR